MILYLASDLIWATKIKSTADSLGIPCRPARTLEMLEARLADSPVKALIVDLEAGSVAVDFIRRARSGPGGTGGSPPVANTPSGPASHPPIHILAFGPHIDTDALQAAKSAGANTVLPRGAFNSRLPQILQELAGAPTTGP